VTRGKKGNLTKFKKSEKEFSQGGWKNDQRTTRTHWGENEYWGESQTQKRKNRLALREGGMGES